MKKKSSFRYRTCVTFLLFFASVFLLFALKAGDSALYVLSAAVPGTILFLMLFPSRVFFLDRPSLAAALMLSGLGIVSVAGTASDFAISLGWRYLSALFFLFFGAAFFRVYRPGVPSAVVLTFFSLLVISFPLLWKSTVRITECGTVLLLLTVISFLSVRLCFPAVLSALAGITLFLAEHEVSAAFIAGISLVLLLWVSSGSGLWSLLSLAVSAALFIGYFSLFPIQSPDESYTGLLSAFPLLAPETPDFSLSSSNSLLLHLCRRFGSLFLLFSVLMLCIILFRGASLAVSARKSCHASIAFCAILLYGLRTLFVLFMLSDLLPFPAGDFPFLTDSFPQLCTDYFLLGLLSGISFRNESDLREDVRLSMLTH